jgi:hypothetical protein
MRIVINCLAVLLGVAALLSLPLPVAAVKGFLRESDTFVFMLLFALPALLFSIIAALIVFRHFRRRDAASAKSVVTASCFVIWLILNTISMNTHRSVDPENFALSMLHLAAPILVAVLLDQLLQKSVDRTYFPAVAANA